MPGLKLSDGRLTISLSVVAGILKAVSQILTAACFIFFITVAAAAQQPSGESVDSALITPETSSLYSDLTPGSPEGVMAEDRPNDPGNAINVEWSLAPGDNDELRLVSGYLIYRSDSPDGDFNLVSSGN